MKPILFSLLLSGLLSLQATAQSQDFESTVFQVIQAFQAQDTISLNAMIHPGTELVIVYAPGIHSIYTSVPSLQSFTAQAIFPHGGSFPIPDAIQWESLPKYECSTLSWNKHGLFCDSSLQDGLIARMPRKIRDFDLGKVSDAEINRMDQIGNISQRVIYAIDDERKLVFYLGKIGKRWYLTALDLITGDCST